MFGGSTLTSTIPGITIAGPSPEATLWTPTLDLEYLVAGRPVSMGVVPVSPEGLPTPAVITRALLPRLGVGLVAVDAGCFYGLRVPHLRLPSAAPGGRIDLGPAMGASAAERLAAEARQAAGWLAGGHHAVVLGETIPGGTTTAAAIMEAYGLPGVELVSSSGRVKPVELKARVARAAAERARRACAPGMEPECVAALAGDPVHLAMSAAARALQDRGVKVLLGGGTQMGAVLALLEAMGGDPRGVAILTTRWILEDESSGVEKIAERFGAALIASKASFAGAPKGLAMYEEGYVKEGVAAGAALVVASARLPGGLEEAVRLVVREYERVAGLAAQG